MTYNVFTEKHYNNAGLRNDASSGFTVVVAVVVPEIHVTSEF